MEVVNIMDKITEIIFVGMSICKKGRKQLEREGSSHTTNFTSFVNKGVSMILHKKIFVCTYLVREDKRNTKFQFSSSKADNTTITLVVD